MKRSLVVLGYGLGGILVALALSWGAFALAGRQIGEPATPVQPAFSLSESPTPAGAPSSEPTESHSHEPSNEPTSSPSHDGSGSDSGSGGSDHPSGGHPGGEDD